MIALLLFLAVLACVFAIWQRTAGVLDWKAVALGLFILTVLLGAGGAGALGD